MKHMHLRVHSVLANVLWTMDFQVPPPPLPEDQDIDYTKLSIGDIQYIRGLMVPAEGEKRKRKKPKKIIVA